MKKKKAKGRYGKVSREFLYRFEKAKMCLKDVSTLSFCYEKVVTYSVTKITHSWTVGGSPTSSQYCRFGQ